MIATTDQRFTVPSHQYGEEWRVDQQGYLHTGSAAPHTDTVVVTLGGER